MKTLRWLDQLWLFMTKLFEVVVSSTSKRIDTETVRETHYGNIIFAKEIGENRATHQAGNQNTLQHLESEIWR